MSIKSAKVSQHIFSWMFCILTFPIILNYSAILNRRSLTFAFFELSPSSNFFVLWIILAFLPQSLDELTNPFVLCASFFKLSSLKYFLWISTITILPEYNILCFLSFAVACFPFTMLHTGQLFPFPTHFLLFFDPWMIFSCLSLFFVSF